MRTRVKAYVCLISFCLGLLSATAGPVMAQQAATDAVSPDARASNTMWQNPYYRAMQTPYYNQNLAYYNPYQNNTNMYQNNMTGVSTTPMANRSQTGGMGGYYNGAAVGGQYNNSYNSQYDQRYSRTYGNRYQPGYYGYNNSSSNGYQLPGIIGAVAGLALGASVFGWMGALIGGIGGYFLGDVVGKWLIPSGLGYNNGYYPSSKVPLISGLIGAGIGAFMLSSFGMFGMVLGATAGFAVARLAVRLIAPQLYYYGFQRPGMYPQNQPQYYYAPGTTPVDAGAAQQQTPAVVTAPKASDTTDNLSSLQEEFYQAMREYKSALVEGTDTEKNETRQKYMDTKAAYDQAKKEALGE